MTAAEALSLFDADPVASVRGTDPRTAKQASAAHVTDRAAQIKALLQRLHEGPVSADTAALVIGRHRSIASARLGVMVRRGLVEPAGEHVEPAADGGRKRKVLHYALTAAGRREHQLLFGGWS